MFAHFVIISFLSALSHFPQNLSDWVSKIFTEIFDKSMRDGALAVKMLSDSVANIENRKMSVGTARSLVKGDLRTICRFSYMKVYIYITMFSKFITNYIEQG